MNKEQALEMTENGILTKETIDSTPMIEERVPTGGMVFGVKDVYIEKHFDIDALLKLQAEVTKALCEPDRARVMEIIDEYCWKHPEYVAEYDIKRFKTELSDEICDDREVKE